MRLESQTKRAIKKAIEKGPRAAQERLLDKLLNAEAKGRWLADAEAGSEFKAIRFQRAALLYHLRR